MPGRFITFEGIDTDVLSEQAEKLAAWLREEGGVKSVVVTREPTDGPLGAQLRLISSGRLVLHDYPFAVLQNADRMDHLFRKGGILDDLQKGSFVLSVRYLLSSFTDINEVTTFEWLMHINQLCRWPDLTIFVDTPITSTLTRLVYEHGFVSEEVDKQQEFFEKMRSGYLKAIEIFSRQEKNIEVIESDSAIAIHNKCIDLIQNSFSRESVR